MAVYYSRIIDTHSLCCLTSENIEEDDPIHIIFGLEKIVLEFRYGSFMMKVPVTPPTPCLCQCFVFLYK
jgi:hypothetical protein